MPFAEAFFLVMLAVMAGQGLLNLSLNVYVWSDARRARRYTSPRSYAEPQHAFTVLLPCRHEEAVIADTLRQLGRARYPGELLEVLVICEEADTGTIAEAERALGELDHLSGRVVTFRGGRINKPRGLNVGLDEARHELVVVFDAEDEVHPDIFQIANTLYLRSGADVVQAGVQLMNVASNWYSTHNVLEYFFWFKSRMHLQTRWGVVPLGGNTVFFRRSDLLALGGWDETCLTEDADIGIRLSSAGKKIVSTYDPRHVTKEETPDSVEAFVKQRTRWNQGFLQILREGSWRRFPHLGQRLFCGYTLAFPLLHALGIFVVLPILVWIGLFGDVPFLYTVLSFVPIFVLLAQVFVNAVGLREFATEQGVRITLWRYVVLIATFVPYQVLLALGALRAVIREVRGADDWEKTRHHGAHRRPVGALPGRPGTLSAEGRRS
jgi:glycosyltransferase XagB